MRGAASPWPPVLRDAAHSALQQSHGSKLAGNCWVSHLFQLDGFLVAPPIDACLLAFGKGSFFSET